MWITQPEAAEILGVHPQTVANMVARGDLTSRGQSGVRGSLDRDEVLALAAALAERLQSAANASGTPHEPSAVRTEHPPDAEHVWLRTLEADEFMGVSQPAISQRARRGRLPFVEHEGRRWFRRGHLELVRHADLVKRPAARGSRMAPQGQRH